jgi:hypothetical protein
VTVIAKPDIPTKNFMPRIVAQWFSNVISFCHLIFIVITKRTKKVSQHLSRDEITWDEPFSSQNNFFFVSFQSSKSRKKWGFKKVSISIQVLSNGEEILDQKLVSYDEGCLKKLSLIVMNVSSFPWRYYFSRQYDFKTLLVVLH